jgi:hypothetical protein
MPPRTVAAPQEAWDRLAAVLRRIRDDRGLTVDDIVDRAKAGSTKGVSRTVISLLENARQTSYAVRTLRAVSVGLGWEPNAIELILNGADPNDLPWSADPIASALASRTPPTLSSSPSTDVIDLSDLTPAHRRAVEGLVQALLDAQHA